MAARDAMAFTLSSVLCLAAHGLAADTGMLYAKSYPPGATVIIEGKERGKTPVLVKGLTPGEVTVERRFPGAKPVAKQVTVEAKRVAKIDVHIELPSASLTIVSEPLEATVFLDNQEVGKTPLTLEDIAPGRHQLVLLKDGHPRTVRSVVIEPGSERVLEVRLGTTGGDESARPATGKGTAKAQAAGRAPVEVQLILTMLKEAVEKCNYAETRRNLALALRQPDMANVKEELRAAIEVVRALEAREDAIRDGADALVGKEVVLKTKTGVRKGKVESVSVEGIAMVLKIIAGGRAVGESRGVVKWTALAPEERDRLAASWKPEGADGAVAQAVLALARRDKAGAGRAVREAGEHPLAAHYRAKVAAWKPVVRTGRFAKHAPTLTLNLGRGVRMEFVYIKPGVFTMGGTEDIAPSHQGWGVEKPKHEVAITWGFYIGKYEVTQARYEAVMGANPSNWKEPNRPVERVTWHDAVDFCRRVTAGTRREVRLPTEAEWEYACRAGTTGRWCFGSDGSQLGHHAWLGKGKRGHTHA
ncbi:MAG: PEGA domain-containing protein, partial [Planctomycetota bacterium]